MSGLNLRLITSSPTSRNMALASSAFVVCTSVSPPLSGSNRVSRLVLKLSFAQEVKGLLDGGFVLHQERLRGAEDEVLGHAGELGVLDGDFSVIATGDAQAIDSIEGTVARDRTDSGLLRVERLIKQARS